MATKKDFQPTETEKLFDTVVGRLVQLNTLANMESDSPECMTAREDLVTFGVMLESAGLAPVMTRAFQIRGEESKEPPQIAQIGNC